MQRHLWHCAQARASVEVKSGSQAINLSDVQGLVLWALLGSEAAACPRWAFVKVGCRMAAVFHTRLPVALATACYC